MQHGIDIGGEGESFIEPIHGHDLILSINLNIQSIAERHIERAVIDNQALGGGAILIMDPSTGDMLAMAEYPNFDLNEPFLINDEELRANWEGMQANERSRLLQQMWRSKVISDGYEPGSTFKILTAAIAIEEGITTADVIGEFHCVGYTIVGGRRIRCWRHHRPHGSQSLREGLANSCNPVFMSIGEQIGVATFYRYLEKFGLFSRTGIDVSR